jgi:hypothetical protein
MKSTRIMVQEMVKEYLFLVSCFLCYLLLVSCFLFLVSLIVEIVRRLEIGVFYHECLQFFTIFHVLGR